MILGIKVSPGCKKSEVGEFQEDMLKVFVKAKPEKGKANKELVSVLADFFGIKKSAIEMVSGFKSRIKKVSVNGIEEGDLSRFFPKQDKLF